MKHALKRRIAKLLLLLYLFSSYLGATHIHKEAVASHTDCKVCVVVKNLHNGDTPASSTLPEVMWQPLQRVWLHGDAVTSLPNKGYNAHAPPAFF